MNEAHLTHYESKDEAFFRTIGIFPYKRPPSKWNKKPDRAKILTLADPHCPYESMKVRDVVKKLHHDSGTVVVAGDVGDYYSKSRFKKTRVQSFDDELRAVFLYIEWLAQHWENVKIQVGNHDNRPEKAIQEALQADPSLMVLTEHNLLAYICSFFDNVELVGLPIDLKSADGTLTKGNLSHIYQHGDIIFTHGEKSQTQSSALMASISLHLFRWKSSIGLKPYSIIAQAHNHANMRMKMGDEYWFQIPTATEMFSVGSEYALSSRMIGTPSSVGYSLFYQENGVTDINRSHNYMV